MSLGMGVRRGKLRKRKGEERIEREGEKEQRGGGNLLGLESSCVWLVKEDIRGERLG